MKKLIPILLAVFALASCEKENLYLTARWTIC